MNKLIAITVDYETWQPIPSGETIDWDADVFTPAARLMDVAESVGAKVTFFVEMGEYFWLEENIPEIAARMRSQWQDIIRRGHDVQLHLHPNWLPELGARHENGEWYWDWSKPGPHDYPGDLGNLIRRCRDVLEFTLQSIDPSYQVTSFRAGAYRAQPFERVYDALQANGVFCDSSVYRGGLSAERGYDYRNAYSSHQPYFANRYDPQLKAPPSESSVVEIPIFTDIPGRRWFLDSTEGQVLAPRLLGYLQRTKMQSSLERLRPKRFASRVYYRAARFSRWLNWIMPKRLANSLTHYCSESLTDNEYFVMIGHTKATLYVEEIAENLRKLLDTGEFQFITLSQMAEQARHELKNHVRKSDSEEGTYQVVREYSAVLGVERNAAQSYHLQAMIPMDRKTALDLGCGAGYWSRRISDLYPWMRVIGIDFGLDFIRKANQEHTSSEVTFSVASFSSLPFADGVFDCVYADNTIEHSFDVDVVLREAYRVLAAGGVLVAALPSDARNHQYICDNHTWKTYPNEVHRRLERAGFSDIRIEEIDTFRRFGMAPYAPSDGWMMYIRAWKRDHSPDAVTRVAQVMNWVYKALSPEQNHTTSEPSLILRDGYAWCSGYAIVMQFVLENEGYKTRRVDFYMKPHPRGHGPEKIDSHSMLEVYLDGRWQLFDPTCNIYFHGYSLAELVESPERAMAIFESHVPDERFQQRKYDLYCTPWAFTRCVKMVHENRRFTYIKRVLKRVPGMSRILQIARRAPRKL